jgi:hypothetical protein
MDASAPKLLDSVRDVILRKHYSIRTEATYCDWIRWYILFHGKKHPKDMGAAEIERFLTTWRLPAKWRLLPGIRRSVPL